MTDHPGAPALPQRCDDLRRRAAEQREVVRWWAAECRARNAACRARFTIGHVAAATEARRTLRAYVQAWTKTRQLLAAAQAALAASVAADEEHEIARH